jgi:hypothetical protein
VEGLLPKTPGGRIPSEGSTGFTGGRSRSIGPHYEAEARKRQGTRTDLTEKIQEGSGMAADHAARDFKVNRARKE